MVQRIEPIRLKGEVLRRWQLYKRLGTEDTVFATLVLDYKDKKDILRYLFNTNCPKVKHLLTGDAVILTPAGFVVEHFVPFHTRYRRL